MASKGDGAGSRLSSLKSAKEGETSSNTEQSGPDAPVEDVPDPEEADLDDLDDMLDDFATKPVPKEPVKPSGPGRPPTNADDPLNLEGMSEDDFAKQLQAGMVDFMKEFEQSPEMQTQFESMLKELGEEGATGDLAGGESKAAPKEGKTLKAPPVPSEETPASASKSGSVAGEESFQETIKKTMERMQASGESATAAASSENSDDFLAEMMKAMQAGGGGGEGSEEDFSKMILGMMEQLTNKEILYEPMKELDNKFPAWMEKNQATTKEEDLKRYKEQQGYAREIVARFEQPGYKDENAADREYIVDRMQKMQAAGSPPADLVGDMAAAQEAFGAPEEGCPTQ